MSERSHRAKYFNHLILGFILIFGSTLLTYFTIFVVQKVGTWYLLAGVSGLLLFGGVYFIASAIGHKLKSDFNRRNRQREVKNHFTNDQ